MQAILTEAQVARLKEEARGWNHMAMDEVLDVQQGNGIVLLHRSYYGSYTCVSYDSLGVGSEYLVFVSACGCYEARFFLNGL